MSGKKNPSLDDILSQLSEPNPEPMIKRSVFLARDDKHNFLHPVFFRKSGGWIKTAAERRELSPEVRAFVQRLETKPGKIYLLSNIIGAGEYWGPNVNGDHWPELVLIRRGHTFVTNGHNFELHMNKDPSKSLGRPIHVFYNPRMHRLEVVSELDIEKARKWIDAYLAGDDVAVSMGAKVPADICAICFKVSKTMADYCDHLKYHMLEIFPDGRQACAINLEPTFFDHSFVRRPAYKPGFVLVKLAEGDPARRIAGAYYLDRVKKEAMEKAAAAKGAARSGSAITTTVQAKKTSTIKKEIPMNAHALLDFPRHVTDEEVVAATKALLNSQPAMRRAMLKKLSEYPVVKVAATASWLGIMLHPDEYQYLVLCERGLQKTADYLADANAIAYDERPDAENKIKVSAVDLNAMGLNNFDPRIAAILQPMIEKRSMYAPYASGQLDVLSQLRSMPAPELYYPRGGYVSPPPDPKIHKTDHYRYVLPLGALWFLYRMIFNRVGAGDTSRLRKFIASYPGGAVFILGGNRVLDILADTLGPQPMPKTGSEMSKKASLSGYALAGGAGFLYSKAQEQKLRTEGLHGMGPSVGGYLRTAIALHPYISAGVGAGLYHVLRRDPVIKYIVNAARYGVFGAIKKVASAQVKVAALANNASAPVYGVPLTRGDMLLPRLNKKSFPEKLWNMISDYVLYSMVIKSPVSAGLSTALDQALFSTSKLIGQK